MILIDTNVISEPWKPTPDPRVLAWIDAQTIDTLFLAAITVAELRFGIAAMPSGKRRNILRDRLEHDVLPLFESRVLPFDLDASQSYAKLMVAAKAAGRAIGKTDGYIAATAAVSGLMVASLTQVRLKPRDWTPSIRGMHRRDACRPAADGPGAGTIFGNDRPRRIA